MQATGAAQWTLYLSQDSEARRVQLWLLQLHHSDPAVLIQVLLIIIIT